MKLLYDHYLHLFHNAKNDKARSFARNSLNYYAQQLGLSYEQRREDKLPRIDFKELLGLKGSLASDGEE